MYVLLPNEIKLRNGENMINNNTPKNEEIINNLIKIEIVLLSFDSSVLDCEISLTELKLKPSSETDCIIVVVETNIPEKPIPFAPKYIAIIFDRIIVAII